jgi:hypothetical protein
VKVARNERSSPRSIAQDGRSIVGEGIQQSVQPLAASCLLMYPPNFAKQIRKKSGAWYRQIRKEP